MLLPGRMPGSIPVPLKPQGSCDTLLFSFTTYFSFSEIISFLSLLLTIKYISSFVQRKLVDIRQPTFGMVDLQNYVLTQNNPFHPFNPLTALRLTSETRLGRYVFYAPQHFLYFFPLPQGQGSLRPTFLPTFTLFVAG
jgi:hypothetical protein